MRQVQIKFFQVLRLPKYYDYISLFYDVLIGQVELELVPGFYPKDSDTEPFSKSKVFYGLVFPFFGRFNADYVGLASEFKIIKYVL